MNIKDIKKRIIKHRATEFDTAVCNHYQFSSDVEYLLSIIEQAEKDMSEIIDLLIGDRYGEAWERSLDAYKTLRLKSIQGDE